MNWPTLHSETVTMSLTLGKTYKLGTFPTWVLLAVSYETLKWNSPFLRIVQYLPLRWNADFQGKNTSEDTIWPTEEVYCYVSDEWRQVRRCLSQCYSDLLTTLYVSSLYYRDPYDLRSWYVADTCFTKSYGFKWKILTICSNLFSSNELQLLLLKNIICLYNYSAFITCGLVVYHSCFGGILMTL